MSFEFKWKRSRYYEFLSAFREIELKVLARMAEDYRSDGPTAAGGEEDIVDGRVAPRLEDTNRDQGQLLILGA